MNVVGHQLHVVPLRFAEGVHVQARFKFTSQQQDVACLQQNGVPSNNNTHVILFTAMAGEKTSAARPCLPGCALHSALGFTLTLDSQHFGKRNPLWSAPAGSFFSALAQSMLHTQIQAQLLFLLVAVSAKLCMTPCHNRPRFKNGNKSTASCLDVLDVPQLLLHVAAVSAPVCNTPGHNGARFKNGSQR